MKLIYAKDASSLAVHILLEELSIPYEAIRVSLTDKKVLESYNPRSYVPALVLDTGEVLTEATSILRYISLEHDSGFLPIGNLERAKCIEWLTFISTELHKEAMPLFHKDGLKKEFLSYVNGKIQSRLIELDNRLEDSAFIMGNSYTLVDMYALAVLRVLETVEVPIFEYPAIRNYKKNLEESPVIKRVIQAEEDAPIETEIRSFTSMPDQQYGDERFI